MLLKKKWIKDFKKMASPVIYSTKYKRMNFYIQHGNTSCLQHSIAVAYYSYALSKALNIKCNRFKLIRGALLHDYFLYDWHTAGRDHSMHGFRHPGAALANAVRDFSIDPVEQNIVLRHMFPLVPVPPAHVEGVIVCIVDKICSLYETFVRNTYLRLNQAKMFPSVCIRVDSAE